MPIIESLLAVMRDVTVIPKSSSKALNYEFRGMDAMLDKIAPAFRAHGIVVISKVTSVMTDEIHVGKEQRKMGYARVVVDYEFHDADSDITVTSVGEAMDSSDKAINKAITQAFKNTLWQTLCIPTGDPDPDASRPERDPEEAVEWTPGQRDAVARLQQRFDALPSTFYAKALEKIMKRAGRPVTKLEALGPLWIPWLDGLLTKAEESAAADEETVEVIDVVPNL